MSADNYYVIMKHPHGGYAAVHWFASSDEVPYVRPDHNRAFPTLQDAFEYASSEYSEYGVRIDPAIIQDAYWGDGATASASKEVIQ